MNRVSFELGAIAAVVENCDTSVVLNDCSLFVGGLKVAQGIGFFSHRPTHVGTAIISIKDDKNTIHSIEIPNALYFPSSPVNFVSTGKLSLNFVDYITQVDEGTCITFTHGRYVFAWNHHKKMRMTIHPDSRLPELIINESQLEQRSVTLFTVARICFAQDFTKSHASNEDETVLFIKSG